MLWRYLEETEAVARRRAARVWQRSDSGSWAKNGCHGPREEEKTRLTAVVLT
jgi:hypothetical protein